MYLNQSIHKKQSLNYCIVNGIAKFTLSTPFFRILLGYILGILLFSLGQIPNQILYFLLGTTFIGIVISTSLWVLKKFRYRWITGTFTLLFFASLGYFNSQSLEKKSQFSSFNKQGIFLVEALSQVSESTNSYKCEVKLINELDSKEKKKVYGKAILYLEKSTDKPSFNIGDYLLVNTRFQPLPKKQNPNEFNYATYLNRKGIRATAYVPTKRWSKTNLPPHKTIKRLSDLSRNRLLSIYKKYGIKENQFALLAAITLGYKDEVEIETKNDFSRSGASHILAISGLHIGIIYGVFIFLLGFWRTKRLGEIIKAVFITTFIWIFAFITGLSPAVQRAATMMTFVAGATCLERKSHIFNTIFSSAFMMLLFNPNLLFNTGFQLSYSAVLSIVYFQPQLKKLITIENPLLRWCWLLLTVTLSAQIGILPIALYSFQQFPNYFIITNFITIPLTTIILYLSIFLIITSYIPIIATLIASVLKIALTVMLYAVGYIASLPFSIISIGITNEQTILLYLFIFIIVFSIYKRNGKVFIFSFSILLFILSISVKRKYSSLTNTQLIVFANNKIPVINMITKGNNYVLTTDSMQSIRNGKRFWLINHCSRPSFYNFVNNQKSFFLLNNKKIMIIADNQFNYKRTEQPFNIDYLIITNQSKPNMKNILQIIHPKLLIIDKTISEWNKNKIIQACQQRKIKYHSIKEKGAFQVEIKSK